jgi:hypothetical protein
MGRRPRSSEPMWRKRRKHLDWSGEATAMLAMRSRHERFFVAVLGARGVAYQTKISAAGRVAATVSILSSEADCVMAHTLRCLLQHAFRLIVVG